MKSLFDQVFDSVFSGVRGSDVRGHRTLGITTQLSKQAKKKKYLKRNQAPRRGASPSCPIKSRKERYRP